MNCVIDASVFVAALRKEEPRYNASRRFLQRVQASNSAVFCPTLILPECAAAIARATGDATLVREVILQIESFPGMQLVPVELYLAHQAAQLAMDCRLRGADSVYAAVAARFGAVLITWDNEMIERSAIMVTVQSPEEWLQENPTYPSD